MLNKNMDGKMPSKELSNAIAKAANSLGNIAHTLYNLSDEIFESSRGIISIPRHFSNYYMWAKEKPSKHGFDFEARFDFWAESKKGMEGVAFITVNGNIAVPLYRDGDNVRCVLLPSTNIQRINIDSLMPLFPRAVCQSLNKEQTRMFNDFQDDIADLCNVRSAWLEGKGTYPNGQLDHDYEGMLKPVESEAISELEEYCMKDTWATVGRRGIDSQTFGNQPQKENPWYTRRDDKMFITKEMLENAMIKTNEKGTEDMTKAAQVKTGMINVNKEALKQVGYLNAGRASNKLIKEAVRPLLNAMFKPTFMQRIAMKLFKMENPVDVALKSGVSDLLCAQMVQAIIEIKGVENPYVREVTQAGITQAGYELSKAIPFEDAIDQVVAHLEKGAEGIVAKISKK